MFITIVSRLEQFKQRRCISAAEMDLYGQSVSGTLNIRSDESGGWFSAVRVGGSMRKVFDWNSGVEELRRIVFSRRGIGHSEIERALQLFNFSTLGKITIARVINAINFISKMPVYLAGRSDGRGF